MRYQALPVLLAILGACDWTSFDSLAKQSWAHSQQTPSGIGSTNYAVAIAPVRGAASAAGGQLAVLGDDEPTYSVLAFDAAGSSKLAGSSVRLATKQFTSLGVQPVFTSDDQQHVAGAAATMIDASTPGIAVVYGTATSPQFTAISVPAGMPNDPGAATYAGSTLVIGVGAQLYQLDTTATMPAAVTCTIDDGVAGGDTVIALASDATTVYAWMQSGLLLELPQALGTTCVPTATITTAGGFVLPAGSRILLAGGTSTYAILAAPGPSGGTGYVYVVDLATGTAGPPLPVNGLASAALGALGTTGSMYLAFGFPDQTVSGKKCGQVELHTFDPATGTLAQAAADQLNDAQPASGQEFGRDLAVMPFNGDGILVVAAKNEIFAYYETHEYPDTRKP